MHELVNAWAIALDATQFSDTNDRKRMIRKILGVKTPGKAIKRKIKHLHNWVRVYIYPIADANLFDIDKGYHTKALKVDGNFILGVYSIHLKPLAGKDVVRHLNIDKRALFEHAQVDESIVDYQGSAMPGFGSFDDGPEARNNRESIFTDDYYTDLVDESVLEPLGDTMELGAGGCCGPCKKNGGKCGECLGGGGFSTGQGPTFAYSGTFDPFKGSLPSINANLYEWDANLYPTFPVLNKVPGGVPSSKSGRPNTAYNPRGSRNWVPINSQVNNRLRTSYDQAVYNFKYDRDGEITYNNPNLTAGLNNSTNSQYARFSPQNEATYWRKNKFQQYYRTGPGLYSFDNPESSGQQARVHERKYPLQNITAPNSDYKIIQDWHFREPDLEPMEWNEAYAYEYEKYLNVPQIQAKNYWEV